MPVTLDDIARKADVSKTTVSRVLNNKDSNIPISEDTKKKVLKFARELGYRPNINARALSMNKSFMLGLIIDDILDPFFNEVIKGAEKYSRNEGYRLILSATDEEPIEEMIEALLNQSAVEGILVGGTKKVLQDENIIQKFIKRGIPIVLLAHSLGEIPCVSIDNFKGGYVATEYLMKLGYRKIGIITGPNPEDRNDSFQRLAGYKEVLLDNQIKPNENYITQGDFSYQSGQLAMGQMLKLSRPPAAVFACDDRMALGAISAVNEAGKRVPEDISIIGFDNIIQAKYSTPKLTTIAQPRIKMGEAATKLLINLIEKEGEVEKKKIVFEPKLIERDSCR